MRRGSADSGSELPAFRLSPVLESYGGDPITEGRGNAPYRCPFHGDRSASANVNTLDPANEWFNCHASDCPTGNAVQIIMKQEGLDYASAVKRAEAISGAGDAPVSRASERSGRMAGGSRSGDGARKFKRPRRGS